MLHPEVLSDFLGHFLVHVAGKPESFITNGILSITLADGALYEAKMFRLQFSPELELMFHDLLGVTGFIMMD